MKWRHMEMTYCSFVYAFLSPALVAFLLLLLLNDARPNVGERVFHITGAHQCGVICCRIQSDDEEKFTQVQTTGLRLPQHFETHILINDH